MSAPRIVVLLATYNGIGFVGEQIASILGQVGVDVRIVISDDGSTDGTRQRLERAVADEPRITFLPASEPTGSSAANFYRLVRDADFDDDEFVAFADQDDVWLAHKLARQAQLLAERGADAVSGSVTAFDADGHEHLVKKDYPQRRLDYLTESPGPGCTFLMTPRLVRLVREVLTTVPEASHADFHDSLIYAIGRARGWGWHIEGEPLVRYRQHASNVFGANRGAASAVRRLRMIRDRWHREQAIIHAVAGLAVAPEPSELERVLTLLRSRRLRDAWRLARLAPELRRRPRDRVVLATLMRLGVW